MYDRVSGKDGHSVDIVVVKLIGIAGHQIAIVINLFDMRLLFRGAGNDDMIDRCVFFSRVDFCYLSGQLHGALSDEHVAGERADGVWLVVAVHAIRMDDVDRLIAIILFCQCRLQEQQPRGQQADS